MAWPPSPAVDHLRLPYPKASFRTTWIFVEILVLIESSVARALPIAISIPVKSFALPENAALPSRWNSEKSTMADSTKQLLIPGFNKASFGWMPEPSKSSWEARESACGVGLFDDRGQLNTSFAERFVEAFGFDTVVFEAPNKSSQFALLNHFGNRVRLCNVRTRGTAASRDLSTRSAFGCLRTRQSETFPPGNGGMISKNNMKKWVSIASFTDGVQDYSEDVATVAIDVIRATTTAVTAIASGRRCYPVSSVGEAIEMSHMLENPLLVGELGGDMPPGFDITNSPAKLAQREDIFRPIILLSSSGTQLMQAISDRQSAYIAELSQLQCDD